MNRYPLTFDAAGCTALPSALRQQMGSDVVLAPGKDGCLTLRAQADWQEAADRIPPEKLRYFRVLLAMATVMDISDDTLVVPPRLQEFAGLEKSAVLTEKDGCWYISQA